MAKRINKNEMVELMSQKYKDEKFDVAINKAKNDLHITVLNKQGSKNKKYLVNDNLIK